METNREVILKSYKAYLFWAFDFTPDELQEWMDDGDAMELVMVRSSLEEKADLLTPEERIEVSKADRAIANTMRPETLAEFIEWFPDYPVQKWWGKPSSAGSKN